MLNQQTPSKTTIKYALVFVYRNGSKLTRGTYESLQDAITAKNEAVKQWKAEKPEFEGVDYIAIQRVKSSVDLYRDDRLTLAEIENRQAIEPFNRDEEEA